MTSDDQGGGPRLDRRQMLVGLAAGGVAGLAGCMEEIDDNDFEAGPVSIPLEELERLSLEQVEEDEIVVEEDRTIDDEDVSAEMTSHVVGYEATGETGGEAQLQATRDIEAEEVVVTIPGEELAGTMPEDVIDEALDVGRLMVPGDLLVEDGEFDPVTPEWLRHVVFPGGPAGPFEELDLGELPYAIEDDVQPFARATDLPTEGIFHEDLQAVPVESLEEALERGISEEHVGRLVGNSFVIVDEVFDGDNPEILEQGVVMIPGDMWSPNDTFIPGNDENPFIPGNDENPFDYAGTDERIDVFDDDTAFVEGTGGIEDRHEIEVGRLELLEQGGFFLPAGSWEAVDSGMGSGEPSVMTQLLGTEGGYAVRGDEVFIPGNDENPFVEDDVMLDPRGTVLLVPEGAIGHEAVASAQQSGQTPESSNMALFHRSALHRADGDAFDDTGNDDRIEMPLPDGETTVRFPTYPHHEPFVADEDGFVVSGEEFVGRVFDDDLADVEIAIFPGEEFSQAAENWDVGRIEAGDTVDVEFVVTPTNTLFDINLEVTDVGRLEEMLPVEEVDVGRLDQMPTGMTVFVDEASERVLPMAYISGRAFQTFNSLTPTRDAVLVPPETPDNSPEQGILIPDPSREQLFFPETPRAFAESWPDAEIVEAGSELPAGEVDVVCPSQYPESIHSPSQYPESIHSPSQYPESIHSPSQYPESIHMPDSDEQIPSGWEEAYGEGPPVTAMMGSNPVHEFDTSVSISGFGQLDGFEATSVVHFPASATFSSYIGDYAEERWDSGVPDAGQESGYDKVQMASEVGALATPEAEVMGESLNPYADTSPEELLTDEETRSLVGRLGLDGVEDGWVEGPESVNTEVGRLLDEDAPVETFLGLTGSREAPEFAVVHVGRLETDDETVFTTVSSTEEVDDVGRVFIGDDGYVSESDLGESIETALDVVKAFSQG